MKRELELEVICGTYEEFVVGYQLYSYHGKQGRQFEQSFADHSHTASVRAVACGGGSDGHLLASGGADEIVKLYDMRRRTEMGQLMDHKGTITCLEFHGQHHLLSGSEDGRLAVVRTDNWQCEKHLGRHVGGLTALAVHPSGRLALTAGRDHKLITWDLIRGRVAFRIHLKAAAEFVVWAPDGSTYAVGVQGRCDVYSVATAGVLHQLKLAAKINCAVYLSDTLVACGDASGRAGVFEVASGRGVTWQAHETRLRAAAAARRSEDTVWLVTAASDGWVKVWETQVSFGVSEEPRPVASYNTTCRLTCVTVHVPPDKRWPPPTADLAGSQVTRGTPTAARGSTGADESNASRGVTEVSALADCEDRDMLVGEADVSIEDEDEDASGGEEEGGGEESEEPRSVVPRLAVKRKRHRGGYNNEDPVKKKKTKAKQASQVEKTPKNGNARIADKKKLKKEVSKGSTKTIKILKRKENVTSPLPKKKKTRALIKVV